MSAQPSQTQGMAGVDPPPGYVYQPAPVQYGQPPYGQQPMMMQQPVPQQMQHTGVGGPYVQDNMILSIISMFFCLPIGGIAVFKAYTSKEKLRAGDIESARQDSAMARKLAIAAIVIGVIFGICILAFPFILFGVAKNEMDNRPKHESSFSAPPVPTPFNPEDFTLFP